MSLADKALLTRLIISQWDGKKLDKVVTAKVAMDNNAITGAGRYNKSLLPANSALQNVQRKASSIRKQFYDNTLPWGLEGTYILPTTNYLTYMETFRQEQSEWKYLVELFLQSYSTAKLEAQRELGSLYDDDDYPPLYELEKRFNIDIKVQPIPSDDFRVELADEELKRVREEVARDVQDASHTAVSEIWSRLYDQVKRVADKLGDPDYTFRNSLIDNTEELCGILRKLNFQDDPNLTAMINTVETQLTPHSPESLREDPSLRKYTAETAEGITARMNEFMPSAAA